MIFAFDFDGTLTNEENLNDNPTPKMEIINLLRKLYVSGHKIIIWTCRNKDNYDSMVKFLDRYNIPYDKINENVDDLGFKTSNKIFAHYYIDDRSLHVSNINILNSVISI